MARGLGVQARSRASMSNGHQVMHRVYELEGLE